VKKRRRESLEETKDRKKTSRPRKERKKNE